MAQVSCSGVSFAYPGTRTPALDELDLYVEDGEFLCILGPSGSGKSTLLRILSGLDKPSAGTVFICGEDVTALPPAQRDIATVGKNHPLYPHMTVGGNITFPLTTAGIAASIVMARLTAVAGDLEIQRILNRYPGSLTPGDRQSAYLARAMIRPVGALLLDEPLAQLDPDDRRRARVQLGTLQRRTKTTTIYVTQDQTEAMTLSDRIAILADGRVHQVVKPLELYHSPATLTVAQFFGTPPMNTLTAVVDGTEASVGELVVPLPERVAAAGLRSVVIGARPEAFHLLPRGAVGHVRFVDHTGNDAFVHARLGSAQGSQEVVVRCSARLAPRMGEQVRLDILEDDRVVFFHPVTGVRL